MRLRNFRPLHLDAFTHRLRYADYLARTLALIRQYFPEENVRVGREEHAWIALMDSFFHRIEQADLFKVDWYTVHLAKESRLEEIRAGNPQRESEVHLALFLQYIPFVPFGFTFEEVFTTPPLQLLVNLLHHIDYSELDDFQVPLSPLLAQFPGSKVRYPEFWTRQSCAAAWKRIDRIRLDPQCRPAPLRHLPELARWATARSGNIILDCVADPETPWPWLVMAGKGDWFEWSQFSQTVVRDWQQAKPIIQAFKAFVEWGGDDKSLAALADFIVLGDALDDLN